MTLTIELTPDTEARLKARAAREGRSEAEIAAEAVEKLLGAEPSLESMSASEAETDDLPKTPAEALSYWERNGALGLWQDRGDSLELARELRREAWARH